MALAKSAILLVMIMMVFCGFSMAAVYNVGDDAGWTAMGHIDYKAWAANLSFHVGDTLVFNYNNQYHNVEQVKQQEFESCKVTSPIVTYTKGSDSITLDKPGHYYFLCGFPGHCLVGQKVDIMVTAASSNPSAAQPSLNNAPSHYSSKLWLVMGVVALCVSGFAY